MKATIRKGLLAVLASAALAVGALASTTPAQDSDIQSAVTRRLADKKELSGVRASVEQGIVTLSGSVDTYPAKLDAAKRARKADHVAGVRNLVAVNAPRIEDAQLQAKLSKELAYDRALQGNVFNVLEVGVHDGVVTLQGEVRAPIDKESALGVVAYTKGVKDVIENVKVAPASIFDDQLRFRLARAIYGTSRPQYALDPQAPIRILVDNGHVSLHGVVNSQVDKIMAGMRARQAFGAFSVENDLVVSR